MSSEPSSAKQDPIESEITRERILNAAGGVFAEVGFRAATVRDICQRADANVAAINYYFGDKERLYAEVLEQARCFSEESFWAQLRADCNSPPEQRLRSFVAAFVRKLLDTGRPTWHSKLMSREMIEPSAALDTMIDRSIRPQFALLVGIVAEILRAPQELPSTYMCAASIIGQCLHYHHTRAVTERLYPGFYDRPGIVDEVAQHIADFSLAALRRTSGPMDAPAKGGPT